MTKTLQLSIIYCIWLVSTNWQLFSLPLVTITITFWPKYVTSSWVPHHLQHHQQHLNLVWAGYSNADFFVISCTNEVTCHGQNLWLHFFFFSLFSNKERSIGMSVAKPSVMTRKLCALHQRLWFKFKVSKSYNLPNHQHDEEPWLWSLTDVCIECCRCFSFKLINYGWSSKLGILHLLDPNPSNRLVRTFYTSCKGCLWPAIKTWCAYRRVDITGFSPIVILFLHTEWHRDWEDQACTHPHSDPLML